MNTNDLSSAAVVKASEKQITANRENALKSTGPKTARGKAIVAMNGIGHGAYTLCPVIEDVESIRGWRQYRKEMLASLAPVGMVEATLAERITLNAWRLRRVVRYETEQMRLTQEGAAEVVGAEVQAVSRRAIEKRHDVADRIDIELYQIAQRAGEPDLDDEYVSDDLELSEEQAQDLLSQAHGQLAESDAFANFWRRLPSPQEWTAGLVRQHVWELVLESDKRAEEGEAKQAKQRMKQQLDEYRREHLLPGQKTLEKVMRYEAHLSRLFHRDLHELERLRAARQGKPVVPPIAIDVDVASDATPGPSTGE